MDPTLVPKRVMVPIDIRHPRAYALRYACMIRELSGAEIIIAFASEEPGHPEGPGFALEDEPQILERYNRELGPFIREHLQCQALPRSVIGIGEPAAVLVELAQTHDIDLIVMAPHRRNLMTRLLVPSVANRLIREAPCAVVCVPPQLAR